MNTCGWCRAPVTYVLADLGERGKWPMLCDAFSEERHDCAPWQRHREDRDRPRLPVAVAADPAVVAAQTQTRAVVALEKSVDTLARVVMSARQRAPQVRSPAPRRETPPSPKSDALAL